MDGHEGEGSRWLLVGVWSDTARLKGEPFAALDLELGALWADMSERQEAAGASGP